MATVPMEMPIDYVVNGDGTAKPIYADADSRVSVTFKRVRRPNVQKMLLTGKEEWIDEIVILKKARGSTNVPATKATEADKRRFAKQWQAFERNEKGAAADGSLHDIYGITSQDVAYLKSMDVHTIQEVIDADESILAGLRNGEELRQLAKIWQQRHEEQKQQAQAVVLVSTYKKENESLRAECERLRRELESKPKSRSRASKKETEE